MAMAAGGTLPDVTELALVHGGTFAGRGFFEDLRPFIGRDRVNTKVFPPVALEAVTWTNGVLWGLPADLYTVPAFFNRDMLPRAVWLTRISSATLGIGMLLLRLEESSPKIPTMTATLIAKPSRDWVACGPTCVERRTG
jgi:maltose-binding protein MalE